VVATVSMALDSLRSLTWHPTVRVDLDGSLSAVLVGRWPGGNYAMTLTLPIDKWSGLPSVEELEASDPTQAG
jgi:hypothetical protein